MSFISSATSIPDPPGVSSAVEHLHSFANRSSNESTGLNEQDLKNIDEIVLCIQELYNECCKAREALETETIKASVLRHKLHHLPGKIKKEISDAIKAARESNSNEMNTLQTNLKDINDNFGYLEKRHEELETENSTLLPERDTVKEEHEEIITQLNQKLAEKAGKQISLNETRDKVRETNQKIMDLEENVIQLKEDLIQERADARNEKKLLKKNLYDVTLKTREQREINVEKKKEVDTLTEEVLDSEAHLNHVRQGIKKYENSRNQLESKEKLLTAQLNRELKQNTALKLQGQNLKDLDEQEILQFEQKRKELEYTILNLDKAIDKQTINNVKLEDQKYKAEKIYEEKLQKRREDEKKVKERNERLQNLKQELAFKASEVGRLTQENLDMEAQIVELGETHKAITQALEKQIKECRENLQKERSDKKVLLVERDVVQKKIDEQKHSSTKFMHEMNVHMKNRKTEHDNLTKEGSKLKVSIKEETLVAENLEQELKLLQQKCKSEKESCENGIKKLEVEIENLKTDLQHKENLNKQKLPGFEKLEQEYEQNVSDFDKLKKNVVVMKNEKTTLEESVRLSKVNLENMEAPQINLRTELKCKRKESLEQLKKHALEVKEIERSIYSRRCRLELVESENKRFVESNDKITNEINEIQSGIEANGSFVANLQQEIDDLKGELGICWFEDNELEKKFANRDRKLVDELAVLLDQTQNRGDLIDGISTKLKSQLEKLAHFIENVDKRRPKDNGNPVLKLNTENSLLTSDQLTDQQSITDNRINQQVNRDFQHFPE